MFSRIRARRAARAFLRLREPLQYAEWHSELWRNKGVSEETSRFVYDHFAKYSGLDFAYVRPEDRLIEDLRFPAVAYGDWDLDLYEDFKQEFGFELEEARHPGCH